MAELRQEQRVFPHPDPQQWAILSALLGSVYGPGFNSARKFTWCARQEGSTMQEVMDRAKELAHLSEQTGVDHSQMEILEMRLQQAWGLPEFSIARMIAWWQDQRATTGQELLDSAQDLVRGNELDPEQRAALLANLRRAFGSSFPTVQLDLWVSHQKVRTARELLDLSEKLAAAAQYRKQTRDQPTLPSQQTTDPRLSGTDLGPRQLATIAELYSKVLLKPERVAQAVEAWCQQYRGRPERELLAAVDRLLFHVEHHGSASSPEQQAALRASVQEAFPGFKPAPVESIDESDRSGRRTKHRADSRQRKQKEAS